MDKATVDRTFGPAARAALEAFPIDARDLTLVSLSENVTFKVTDGRDGRPYVRRLHRPGYHTLEELVSERAWIRALAEAGIDVPDAVMTRDGQDYVPVIIAATGEKRFAGMAGWTEGRLLSDVLAGMTDQSLVEASFKRLGAITAAMHIQASAWTPPPGFKRHALDSDGLMGMAPHWGEFWEHRSLTGGERSLLLDVRQRLHALLSRLSRDPSAYSVIHADLHPGNIVVDGDCLTVIDFDDAGYGWHQYDIATALTHWQTKPNAADIERAFLAGYRAQRPVPDEALSLIPQFRLIRWMATIGWFHQRSEVNRPSAIFEERKAWVLDQCAALQRSR
jgi:Ser/Thr protein kinase RdoA (MazF antagonist)